ncbi:hypothetical protein ACFOY2_17210 [Nonomuraea purpurea]|uniref:RHS repeat protein n=1 Tax=Nonomuraea purpurea TaxID=1849276 RepID=A0ABV8G4T6_9ACTN
MIWRLRAGQRIRPADMTTVHEDPRRHSADVRFVYDPAGNVGER